LIDPNALSQTVTFTGQGTVTEGYISGATVFADANNNGKLDPGEVSTTTDANGNFAFSVAGTGPLVAFGGTDSSTGLPFKGQFSAPEGSTAITPLTTLLTDLQPDPAAEQKILAALGLSSTLDVTTFDPIAAAKAGSLNGAATEVAGAKVYDTVALIASALAGAGGIFASGVNDAFSALANAMDQSGISLTDQSALTALISQIAQSENIVLGQGVAGSIAAMIVAGNTALNNVLQTDQTGAPLLNDVASIELVMQGAASNAIQQAANNAGQIQGVVTTFSGTNLQNLITAGVSQVGPDGDTGEQALLKLTVGNTAVNAATASTVSFTVAGLDLEDTGTVTFTDANGKTVQVNVNGGQASYTANLTSLADGTITSSLAVKPDAAGNTFVPVSGTPLTLTQLDHWTNASGGNWATASSWSTWNGTHAVPTATIDADFDALGTYAVNITTADTAYALLLNDSGATVSDKSGGSLTLTGSGGAQSPTGLLSINQGTFVLAGGGLHAGSIFIGGGSTLLVTQGQYAGQNSIPTVADNGSFMLANNANATIAGSVSGAGSFTVGDNANLTVSGADTVTGSFTLGNNSNLELIAPETAKIIFAGSNSLLKFDAVSPTGQISGLNATDKIDLAGLRWVQGSMTARFSGGTSGGILTVSNGAQSVAINLAGNYMQSSWHLSADKTGGTFVVDPPAVASNTAPGETANNDGAVNSGELLELKTGTPENVQFAAGTGTLQLDDAQHFGGLISGFSGQDVLDLADIAFSPNMSLGYAANTNNSGGNLTVNDGTHVASLALLGNYMASSFVASSDGHGGTFIEPSQIASYQQSVLTHPHA
jgi:hypothetical protein